MVSRSVDDRQRSALEGGRARGPVGALQVEEAHTDDLEAAISFAGRAPRLSRRTQCLLRTCRTVLGIRTALRIRDWAAVRAATERAHEAGFLIEGGAALSGPSAEPAGEPLSDPVTGRLPLHPMSRPEIEAARKEAADALVSAAVRDALHSGAAVAHTSLTAAARGAMGILGTTAGPGNTQSAGGVSGSWSQHPVSPRRKLTLMLRAAQSQSSQA